MPEPTLDDAVAYIIEYARNPPDSRGYSSYGYQIYIPNILDVYLREVEHDTSHIPRNTDRARQLSSIFMEAGWELCRKGILRPGIRRMDLQATEDGASGNGYTITSHGQTWLAAAENNLLMVQPGRMNELFSAFSERFGSGFLQRAQEASSCHFSGAYLACCAMCGAAAESIILSIATAKKGNEKEILQMYLGSQGRSRVKNYVVGQAAASIARPFESAMGLLAYWRDDAAHGLASTISEIEAHDALARLLRFAQFSSDNWHTLTART